MVNLSARVPVKKQATDKVESLFDKINITSHNTKETLIITEKPDFEIVDEDGAL